MSTPALPCAIPFLILQQMQTETPAVYYSFYCRRLRMDYSLFAAFTFQEIET